MATGTQFTPGPWTASVEAKPFAAGGHWYVVTDSEENGIGEFYGDDHEANAANLRLASAAPDLYEIADLIDRTGYGLSREHRIMLREACAKVRAEQVSA